MRSSKPAWAIQQNHGLQMWLSVKYVYSMQNCLDSILSIIKKKEKKLLDSKKKVIDSFPKLSLKSKPMLKIEVGTFTQRCMSPETRSRPKQENQGAPPHHAMAIEITAI